MTRLAGRTHAQENGRGRGEHRLLRLFEAHPEETAFLTATALAARFQTHPATVVRFAQSLGYLGFPEFQAAFRRQYLAGLPAAQLVEVLRRHRDENFARSSLLQDSRNLDATLAGVEIKALRELARLLLHHCAGIAVADGMFAPIAELLSRQCQTMSIAMPAHSPSDPQLSAALSTLTPGQPALFVTGWRYQRGVEEAMNAARERLLTIIAITDDPDGEIAQSADIALCAATESASFFPSLVGPMMMINALVAEMVASADGSIYATMDASHDIALHTGRSIAPSA